MNFSRCLLLPLCLVLTSSSLASAAEAGPETPANLAVPADEKIALVASARGVQIYVCQPTAADPNKYEWAFQAPEADLFDAQGSKIGRHYAGPTWELSDGSKVVGRVKAKADAPNHAGVAWLLLDAVQTSGEGVLSEVRSIQRLDTAGGLPPQEAATADKAGQERRVEYTATYKFFAAGS